MQLPSIIQDVAPLPQFLAFTADKCPICPYTGESEGWNLRSAWSPLADADRRARMIDGHLGIMPVDMVIVDFDGAVVDGEEHPWVRQWLNEIGCDVAVSVSETGRHGYPAIVVDEETRELLKLRRVFKSETNSGVPIKQIEFRTGLMPTIVRPIIRPASKNPADQLAAVKRLLQELLGERLVAAQRSESSKGGEGTQRAPTRWHLELWQGARIHGHGAAYQTSLQLRQLDRNGAGFVSEADALAHLERRFAAGRKHPGKAARRKLDQLLSSSFAERCPNKDTGETSIRFVSLSRVAERLGCELGPGVLLPDELLWSLTPGRLATIAVELMRGFADHFPRPTSRQMNRSQSGVSASTQRRAEQAAGVRVCKNFLISDQPQYGRDRIQTPHGVAYQIANSYDVRMHQPGCGSLTPGRVQTGQRLYLRADEVGEMGRQFVEWHVHNGYLVGLWHQLGDDIERQDRAHLEEAGEQLGKS